MAKIVPGDIKAILREFNVKNSGDSNQRIDNIKEQGIDPAGTVVTFRFDKRRYCIIYDETADDDTSYLTKIATTETGSREGEFLTNPSAPADTYGLFFKGKTVYLYMADAGKKRLDVLLAETRPEASRSTWQKQIKSGEVRVNGEVIESPKYEVSLNDDIEALLPEPVDHSDQNLEIIYEDQNVIVVNKPAGILTHAKGVISDEFTVADFFRRRTEVGLDTNRPGIIHRLDRDTSGVLIGAKNEDARALLARQFAERKTKKTYIAIVSGQLKQKEATIELPIGRNPSAPSTFRVDPKGKPATTHYRVIAEHDGTSLIELRPVTGRTHQLRVHMAYLGAPIVGDRVYGRANDRLFLHAKNLEITIPISQRTTFNAPLPKEFIDIFPEAA